MLTASIGENEAMTPLLVGQAVLVRRGGGLTRSNLWAAMPHARLPKTVQAIAVAAIACTLVGVIASSTVVMIAGVAMFSVAIARPAARLWTGKDVRVRAHPHVQLAETVFPFTAPASDDDPDGSISDAPPTGVITKWVNPDDRGWIPNPLFVVPTVLDGREVPATALHSLTDMPSPSSRAAARFDFTDRVQAHQPALCANAAATWRFSTAVQVAKVLKDLRGIQVVASEDLPVRPVLARLARKGEPGVQASLRTGWAGEAVQRTFVPISGSAYAPLSDDMGIVPTSLDWPADDVYLVWPEAGEATGKRKPCWLLPLHEPTSYIESWAACRTSIEEEVDA